MKKVICQNGVEAEFKAFGIAGVFKEAVVGVQDNGNKYLIGEYKDGFTAITVLSKLIQHEGEKPYKMPPEGYEVKIRIKKEREG